MPTYSKIPLTPQAQIFSVVLANATYRMRATFDTADQGGWFLDIADADSSLLVAGIPLVTGVDLLAQYVYLGLAGSLYLTTDRGAGEYPTFTDLGLTSHLFFVTP